MLGTLLLKLSDFGESNTCGCFDSLLVELARNPTFGKPEFIGIYFRRLAGERDPALYRRRAEAFLKQIKPRGSLRPFCEMFMVEYYTETDREMARELIAQIIANKNAAWYHVQLLERLKEMLSIAGESPGKAELAILNRVRARTLPGSSTWKPATLKEFAKRLSEISVAHSAEEANYHAYCGQLEKMVRDNADEVPIVAHIRNYLESKPIEPFRSFAVKLLKQFTQG